MANVINQHGKILDFDAVVNLMDDDLREEVHALAIISEQNFFDEYVAAHLEKFGEPFELAKPTPVW